MQPNLTDATLYAGDPYPTYRWLRREAPVYWDAASRLWVVSRYDDVVQVSKTPEVFSAAQGVLPESDAPVSIVCMDDPRHHRLLSVLNRRFTPRMVRLREKRVRQHTTEQIDPVDGRG